MTQKKIWGTRLFACVKSAKRMTPLSYVLNVIKDFVIHAIWSCIKKEREPITFVSRQNYPTKTFFQHSLSRAARRLIRIWASFQKSLAKSCTVLKLLAIMRKVFHLNSAMESLCRFLLETALAAREITEKVQALRLTLIRVAVLIVAGVAVIIIMGLDLKLILGKLITNHSRTILGSTTMQSKSTKDRHSKMKIPHAFSSITVSNYLLPNL